MMPSAQSDLHEIGTNPPLGEYLRRVWSRREFVAYLPFNVLRSQNRDTALGNLWHLANPMLQVGVYYVVFGVILDTTRGVDNFMGFLTVGLFTYSYSQKSLTDTAGCLHRNEGLIRSIQFPRVILPMSTIMGQAIAFGSSLAVLIATALVTGDYPTWRWLLIIPIYGLQTIFNLGGGLVLARLAYGTRDALELLPHLFRLVFYTSGVMFSIDAFVQDELWRRAFDLNPFFAFVELARWAVLGREIHPLAAGACFAWSVGLFLVGFAFFRAADHKYGRA